MIRDPSDGSVRKPSKPMVSGLPAPEDPGDVRSREREAERDRRSREWLEKYKAAKRASPVSPALDKAIQDELDHPPASIMKED